MVFIFIAPTFDTVDDEGQKTILLDKEEHMKNSEERKTEDNLNTDKKLDHNKKNILSDKENNCKEQM